MVGGSNMCHHSVTGVNWLLYITIEPQEIMRDFIICMHDPLMMLFQVTPISMTFVLKVGAGSLVFHKHICNVYIHA